MRDEKSLIALLQGLVGLLAAEAARNPAFAAGLDSLLADLPQPKAKTTRVRKAPAATADPLPDIRAEWTARGDAAFRLWLQDQAPATLKAIIRAEDLDSTRRTAKWTKADKLAGFISEGLAARLTRGSAFMRGASNT